MNPLKELRVALGLSQAEFGRRVGYSRRTIGEVERGETPISEQLARGVRSAFGLDLSSHVAGQADDATISRQLCDYIAVHGECSYGELLETFDLWGQQRMLRRALGELVESGRLSQRIEYGLTNYRRAS